MNHEKRRIDLGEMAASVYTSREISAAESDVLSVKGVEAMRNPDALALAAMIVFALSGTVWTAVGRADQDQSPDGAAAKAGEKIDELGRAIKKGFVNAEEVVRDGLHKTGGTVRDSFTKNRETIQRMGLLPRVYGRLHWDKALHSSTLFVKTEGGTVTLSGTIPDDAARDKAVALVQETVGVTHVIDQLNVLSPSPAPSNSTRKR